MTALSQLLKIGCALLALQILAIPSISAADGSSDNLLLSVVPYRTAEDIRADLDHASVAIPLAQERYTKAKTDYGMVQARIEARKDELKVIEQNLKNAKKSDNKAQVIAIEASKNSAEQILDLLESRKRLRNSEVDVAEADNDLAQASKYALSLELELNLKRTEQESMQTSSNATMDVSALSQTIRTLEGKCLEAQQEEANKTERLANREKQVMDLRLRLFDLQGKVLGDKR
jgi:uncharacterized protein (DUF3084 family)